MPNIASFSKCLYCLWPGAVIFICFMLAKGIDGITYYGALPVGTDPLSPQGQADFETQRERDASKRKIIYWCIGIIAGGYLAAFLYNTFTIKAAAASPTATPTLESTATLTVIPATPTEAATFISSSTPTYTGTPTYAPTATDRVVYLVQTRIVEQTVIITQIVPVEITSTPTAPNSEGD